MHLLKQIGDNFIQFVLLKTLPNIYSKTFPLQMYIPVGKRVIVSIKPPMILLHETVNFYRLSIVEMSLNAVIFAMKQK